MCKRNWIMLRYMYVVRNEVGLVDGIKAKYTFDLVGIVDVLFIDMICDMLELLYIYDDTTSCEKI